MGSYTDSPQILGNFSPYVQQLPVSQMVDVGVRKQQQYDEGIQRIQASIDNVAGLDVIRDVDKKYLQSKMDELGNNLKSVAAGDFSNFQLVNSTAGMVGNIAKDKNVLNAVGSAAKYRQEITNMNNDRKEGKLTPDNEFVFNKQASSWVNGGLEDSFNATYTPHFDIFKFAKETFDEILPDGMSFDQIYQLGADGKPITDKNGNLIYSPTMTRMEKEGRMPEKVKETITQIFSDPRVTQQLGITGQYNYRGYSPEQLSVKILSQKDQLLSTYKSKLDELTIQKGLGKDVQKEMDGLQSVMTYIANNYDQYSAAAFDNPDAIRGLLYTDDVSSRYTTMFGQVKTKEQILENPGWRTQFDMQKEANSQSRWSQDFAQKKLEHADDQAYRAAKLKQDEDIAKGKLAFENRDAGMEQGTEPSNIDVIRLQTTNFENAASAYGVTSDALIWETVLGKDQFNQNKVKTLMERGLKREQAISTVISDLAQQNNQSPEEFKTTWVDKSIIEFNKLTPEEKQRKSLIGDAYTSYKEAKRIFDSELIVKKRIDERTTKNLGEVGKQLANLDIKPETVTYEGKQEELTKADVFDLAIYNKGRLFNLHSLVHPEEVKAYERESKNALQRLVQRGKGNLVDAFLKDSRSNKSDIPFSGGTSGIKWDQVRKVEQLITKEEYGDALTEKARIIKESYGIKPNLKTGLFTGETKIDNNILYNIKRWAGEKKSVGQNLSGDLNNFTVSDKLDENNLGMGVILDGNNNPQVEIISYDKDGQRTGGMTLQPDEASRLNINVSDLYESKEVSALRSKINYNDFKTCSGDPDAKSTYLQGDVYYDTSDFANLSRSNKYDVKANIVFSNGKYYPYLYMTDGKKSTIEQLDGDVNLQKVVTSLRNINPVLVEKYLTEK